MQQPHARVSTEKDEQQNSYEAQIEYYTRYIKSNPEWIFVDIYSDEGITGTSIKRRDGFNKMIEDALAGKIDLIVTKSVSRFARNTVDSLTTVRKLKDKGVEVYFEKENIFTLDSKGELLITIMSSLAQEESRSISENTTWGQRKRFADGIMSLGYSTFLGYKKGANPGDMEIVEEEAVIVRRIYDEYLAGKSPGEIAKRLTADGIPTPAKKTRWHTSTIISILHNEKYRGDAKLQKCFTTSFLDHKMQKNTGHYPFSMFLKTTRQLSSRRSLRWFKRSSADERLPVDALNAYPSSQAVSYAVTAVAFTAEKSGIRIPSMYLGAGIAITSS